MVIKNSDIKSYHKKLLKQIPNTLIGVYALKDYFNHTIYVGQTWESLRNRIRYHFTRSDILAKHQINPREVAYVEYWVVGTTSEGKVHKPILSLLESYIFHHFHSQFPLVNTKIPKVLNSFDFNIPQSNCVQILPDELIKLLSKSSIWKRTKKDQLLRMKWYMETCNCTKELKRSYQAIKMRYLQIKEMNF